MRSSFEGFWPRSARPPLLVKAFLITYLRGHVEDLSFLGLNDILERLLSQRGALGHLVQLGHISSVVLLVVEGNSLLRDVGSKSVLSVGERRESEGHLGVKRLSKKWPRTQEASLVFPKNLLEISHLYGVSLPLSLTNSRNKAY